MYIELLSRITIVYGNKVLILVLSLAPSLFFLSLSPFPSLSLSLFSSSLIFCLLLLFPSLLFSSFLFSLSLSSRFAHVTFTKGTYFM